MTGRDNDPQPSEDDIAAVRNRICTITHNRLISIREELDITACKLTCLVTDYVSLLTEYAETVRPLLSKDDTTKAGLDDILQQIQQVETKLYETVELPDDVAIPDLDNANRLQRKNKVLLELVSKLHSIHDTLDGFTDKSG